jgi:hypothetical protein
MSCSLSDFLLYEQVFVHSDSLQAHLEGVILEFGNGNRAGAVKVAYLAPGVGTKEKWIAPHDVARSLQKHPHSGIHFAQGESLQFWSATETCWKDVVVIDRAQQEMYSDGVPLAVGSVKVFYSGVDSWIPAEERFRILRAPPPSFHPREQVRVYEPSSSEWFEGTVLEVASQAHSHNVDSKHGQFKLQIAAGSPRVQYGLPRGQVEDKWIPLELCHLRIQKVNIPAIEARHLVGACENDASTQRIVSSMSSIDGAHIPIQPARSESFEAPPLGSYGAYAAQSFEAPSQPTTDLRSPYPDPSYASHQQPSKYAQSIAPGSYLPTQPGLIEPRQYSSETQPADFAYSNPYGTGYAINQSFAPDTTPGLNTASYNASYPNMAVSGPPAEAQVPDPMSFGPGLQVDPELTAQHPEKKPTPKVKDSCTGRKARGDGCTVPAPVANMMNRFGFRQS